MLDLDKYMNHSIKVRWLGRELDILEPSVEMVMQVDKIESDMTEENIQEKRIELAKLFLDHNKQGEVVEKEDIRKLPIEAIARVIAEVSIMRYEADMNPNSKSQSQKEK